MKSTNKQLNILMVAPTPFFANRGTHIRILEEALALERRGHRVTIATYHIGSDIPDEYHSSIDVRRILRLLFWYKKLEAGADWQKIFLNILLIRKVFFLTRKKRPDIIHGHLHEGVLIGWMVKKLFFWRDITLVSDFHGELVSEMESHGYLSYRFIKRIFCAIEECVDGMGDVQLTSSPENRDRIAKLFPHRPPPFLVSDGVNLHHYDQLEHKGMLRKMFDLPDHKIVIIYSGALLPNKGLAMLVDSAKALLRERSDLHFVFAGFPEEHIVRMLEGVLVKGNVTLISPLPYVDLPRLNSACDIGVDPKTSDNSQASGKILQYMAAALPVVCVDRPTNRRYLGSGAYYSHETTIRGLIHAIRGAISDRVRWPQVGEDNRKRVEAFRWDRSGEQLEEIYRTVLTKKQKS